MSKVCIMDYGSGNVKSVYNLVKHLGYETVISNSKYEIQKATHLILPGVGSFASAMSKIKSNIPLNILNVDVLDKKKPILGICVGMQVMANKGYENGENIGLGWIDGTVRKINVSNSPLPHIGWNNIIIKKKSKLTSYLDKVNDFYFVHSYAYNTERDYIIAETDYEEQFPSIIKKDNIYGVQFHPEKSQKAGQQLLKNFLNI